MLKTQKKKQPRGLSPAPVLELNAAGVDIGATEIYIAVPPDRDTQPVRRFATFTEDLLGAADWLQRCRIETVAKGDGTIGPGTKPHHPESYYVEA